MKNKYEIEVKIFGLTEKDLKKIIEALEENGFYNSYRYADHHDNGYSKIKLEYNKKKVRK